MCDADYAASSLNGKMLTLDKLICFRSKRLKQNLNFWQIRGTYCRDIIFLSYESLHFMDSRLQQKMSKMFGG